MNQKPCPQQERERLFDRITRDSERYDKWQDTLMPHPHTPAYRARFKNIERRLRRRIEDALEAVRQLDRVEAS
ncbi:MAG TPA: hypothetical protein VEW42_04430 [Candidatus Eisenbacteria bacterium]|nr:hypothetical protein [Candidatus Eisenbacteria bacterium]